MTYLLGPDAMKLFFSAADDEIAFRQADPYFTSLLHNIPHLSTMLNTTVAHQAGRPQSTSQTESLGYNQIYSSQTTQPCSRA